MPTLASSANDACLKLFAANSLIEQKSVLSRQSNDRIKGGRFNDDRLAHSILLGIPQLKELYKNSGGLPVSHRPVLIEGGAGRVTAAKEMTEENYKKQFINILAITANTVVDAEETNHLKILKGKKVEEIPISTIKEKIRELRASTGNETEDGLADGGYEVVGIFSYTDHPESYFRQLNQLLKVGSKYYIVSANGHIEHPGGMEQIPIPGMEKYGGGAGVINRRKDGGGAFSYLAGEQPDPIDFANDSTVITKDGKRIPLFDFLARLGGFRVEYWNHGKGDIQAYTSHSGLPFVDLHTKGDVIILTKTGDVTDSSSELELLQTAGSVPPRYDFRERSADTKFSLAQEVNQLENLNLGSAIYFDPKAPYYSVSKYKSEAVESQVISFSPEAMIQVYPLAYQDVYLSILPYSDSRASNFFETHKNLITQNKFYGFAYEALYDVLSGKSQSPALTMFKERLNKVRANNQVSIEELKQLAIAEKNPYGITIESLMFGPSAQIYSLYEPAESATFAYIPELKQRGWQLEINKHTTAQTRYSAATANQLYHTENSLHHLYEAWTILPAAREWLRQNVSGI